MRGVGKGRNELSEHRGLRRRIALCLIAGILLAASPACAWILQLKTVGEVVAVWLLSNPGAVLDAFKTTLGQYQNVHRAEALANVQRTAARLLDGYAKSDLRAVAHYTRVLEDIRRNERLSIPELDRLIRRSGAFIAWASGGTRACGLEGLSLSLNRGLDLLSEPDMKVEIRSPQGRTVYQSDVRRDSRFARWNPETRVDLDDLEIRVYDQDLLGRELVGDFRFRRDDLFRRLRYVGKGVYEAEYPLSGREGAGSPDVGILTLRLSGIPSIEE